MELQTLPTRTGDFTRTFCSFGSVQYPLTRIPPDPQPKCHSCRSQRRKKKGGEGNDTHNSTEHFTRWPVAQSYSPLPSLNHKGFAHIRVNAGTLPVVTHFSGLPPVLETIGKCLLKLHSRPWVFAAQKWLPLTCISRMLLPHKQSEKLQLDPLPEHNIIFEKKGIKNTKGIKKTKQPD